MTAAVAENSGRCSRLNCSRLNLYVLFMTQVMKRNKLHRCVEAFCHLILNMLPSIYNCSQSLHPVLVLTRTLGNLLVSENIIVPNWRVLGSSSWMVVFPLLCKDQTLFRNGQLHQKNSVFLYEVLFLFFAVSLSQNPFFEGFHKQRLGRKLGETQPFQWLYLSLGNSFLKDLPDTCWF